MNCGKGEMALSGMPPKPVLQTPLFGHLSSAYIQGQALLLSRERQWLRKTQSGLVMGQWVGHLFYPQPTLL